MTTDGDSLALIDADVAAVRQGEPRVVVIEGDPGFGKSFLLRHVLRRLDGFEVRRAYGEPDAPDDAFAALLELVPEIGDGEGQSALHALRQVQRALDAATAEAPVAFVIDDFQWVDAESARVIASMVRRLVEDRLLVIVATRPLGDRHPDWQRALNDVESTHILLNGLTAGEIDDLPAQADKSDGRLAKALQEHTSGNPLYVTSLLREHSVDELARLASIDELPVPTALASHLEARIAALSPGAAALLNALAVLGDGWSPPRCSCHGREF